jgi:hypothetical protein
MLLRIADADAELRQRLFEARRKAFQGSYRGVPQSHDAPPPPEEATAAAALEGTPMAVASASNSAPTA